jgi:hypothetical protein
MPDPGRVSGCRSAANIEHGIGAVTERPVATGVRGVALAMCAALAPVRVRATEAGGALVGGRRGGLEVGQAMQIEGDEVRRIRRHPRARSGRAGSA